jgi:DNA-binding transcriptional LysR family regulator
MTLTQLRYFIAIVDSGLNITLAAGLVHATQPGVSKQIKQLESELGCLLFTRKGRSLEALTPAGKLVVGRARLILEETANIRSLAANLRHESHGEFCIATTHTQARFVLPPVVAELKRRYADVAVHIDPGGEEHTLEALESGQADIAVMSTAAAPPVAGLSLPVYRWDRVILVPRGHVLAAGRKPPTLLQLAEHPLVSYESSVRANSSLYQAFAREGLKPRIAVTARDADLIKTYVRAGLGVGILAEMAVQDADLEDLVVLPAGDLFARCITWMVLRRDRIMRDYAFDFVELFAPHIGRSALRRVLDGQDEAPIWPEPPHWRA